MGQGWSPEDIRRDGETQVCALENPTRGMRDEEGMWRWSGHYGSQGIVSAVYRVFDQALAVVSVDSNDGRLWRSTWSEDHVEVSYVMLMVNT
jgi:hypothetical protein